MNLNIFPLSNTNHFLNVKKKCTREWTPMENRHVLFLFVSHSISLSVSAGLHGYTDSLVVIVTFMIAEQSFWRTKFRFARANLCYMNTYNLTSDRWMRVDESSSKIDRLGLILFATQYFILEWFEFTSKSSPSSAEHRQSNGDLARPNVIRTTVNLLIISVSLGPKWLLVAIRSVCLPRSTNYRLF